MSGTLGQIVLSSGPTITNLTAGGTLTVSSALAVGSNTATLLQGGVRFGRTTVADANLSMTTNGGSIVAYTSITAPRTVTFATGGNSAAPQWLIIKDESGSVTGTNKIILSGPTVDGGASPTDAVTTAFGVRMLYCISSTVCEKIL